jgi:dihydroorotase
MPNTSPIEIRTAVEAAKYRGEIKELCRHGFTPLMTIKLLDRTTPHEIQASKAAGVIAGKVYPQGVTTNSDNGPADLQGLYSVFAEMERVGMVLCLHGEDPKAFCLDRESTFLAQLCDIARCFPKLKIVMEHVTTLQAVGVVKELPDTVAATITAHHLYLTLDDVIGAKLHPHNFCMPIAKRPQDRDALRRAVLSGNPKFFLGTDSAPHVREMKECSEGCAGVFTAPMVIPLLTSFFEEFEALEMYEHFTSENGARFYGLPLNEGKMRLVRQPFRIPDMVEGVVPYLAGKTLNWRIE